MNKNRVISLAILIIMIIAISINAYAVTLPELMITSNSYSAGDKITNDDITSVEVEKTIQLYAVIAHGNDVVIDNNTDSIGWFVDESNLSGVTWESSDINIATVDNTGKVTGVSEGETTITATYNNKSAYYDINVTAKSEEPYTGIRLYIDEPGPVMSLNTEDNFSIELCNIPKTEKENVVFRIENNSIAEITKTEYDKNWADAIVTVKYLSVGKTKLIATLSYNGETYSDSYDLDVIEANEVLELSADEYTDLPTTLKIGDNIQLTATLKYIRGSLVPRDVTSDGVIWASSDETVATVDNKGLVTAIGEGTTTITAKYLDVDVGETVSTKYELKVTDPNKTPENPDNTTNNTNALDIDNTTKDDPTISPTTIPKTGINIITMIIGFISILATSIIAYIRYRKIKGIK